MFYLAVILAAVPRTHWLPGGEALHCIVANHREAGARRWTHGETSRSPALPPQKPPWAKIVNRSSKNAAVLTDLYEFYWNPPQPVRQQALLIHAAKDHRNNVCGLWRLAKLYTIWSWYFIGDCFMSLQSQSTSQVNIWPPLRLMALNVWAQRPQIACTLLIAPCLNVQVQHQLDSLCQVV